MAQHKDSEKVDYVWGCDDYLNSSQSEADRLALTGAKLAGQVWTTEDFSDWEGFVDERKQCPE